MSDPVQNPAPSDPNAQQPNLTAPHNPQASNKEPPLVKQCRVKFMGLQRYQKEYNSYQKELVMNENKVQQMTSDGKCDHDINKQREVMKETQVMIPIIKDKLFEAMEDLVEFLEDGDGEEVKKLSEETYNKAKEQVELTKAFLDSLEESEKN